MKYYSCDDAISYGTPFIFTLGGRAIGKTFAYTCYAIDRFLNEGSKFLYIGLDECDLMKVSPHFFDPVKRKYADHDMEVVGNGGTGTRFMIDNKEAGLCISIYEPPVFSQSYMSEFDTILYDMFIGWKGDKQADVVYDVLNLYNTVTTGFLGCFRDNVKFIFIDNHITLNNMYFSAFGMLDNLDLDSRYCVDRDGLYLLELTSNESFVKEKNMNAVEYNRMARRYKPYIDLLRGRINHKI